MRKFIHLKFFSCLLLVVMLTVAIVGAHESAYAMQSRVTAASDHTSTLEQSEISASHQCPCAPLDQHQDSDCCDTCTNCACHAPLTMQPFQLSYNPIILDLSMAETFKHLPEVYLSKFIPPQKQA